MRVILNQMAQLAKGSPNSLFFSHLRYILTHPFKSDEGLHFDRISRQIIRYLLFTLLAFWWLMNATCHLVPKRVNLCCGARPTYRDRDHPARCPKCLDQLIQRYPNSKNGFCMVRLKGFTMHLICEKIVLHPDFVVQNCGWRFVEANRTFEVIRDARFLGNGCAHVLMNCHTKKLSNLFDELKVIGLAHDDREIWQIF